MKETVNLYYITFFAICPVVIVIIVGDAALGVPK